MIIYTSQRLETVLASVEATMQSDPLPPLEPEVIIVAQNQGLRSWLELALARKLGCAASIYTPTPRAFCVDLIRRYIPQERIPTPGGKDVPSDPFEYEGLTWRIVSLLESLPGSDRYRPLHAYLERARHGLLPLAARIAKCFDDYQVYRPGLLAAWQQGQDPFPEWPHSDWQANLWCRLVAGVPGLDRAAELERLIDWLAQRQEAPHGLPRRITVFGALLFPPIYLRVLHAVSRFVPVTFYAVIPVAYDRFLVDKAGGRLSPDNLLTQHLGARGREFFSVLEALRIPLSDTEQPMLHIEVLADSTPEPTSALHLLQADVLKDVARGTSTKPPHVLEGDDRSLQVHDCHSPLRELEVLRDQLLDAFESIPDLRPHQVQVIVSDLATYAPLIDAVFGTEQTEALRLPYHIVGNPLSAEERVMEALRKVLHLSSTRLTSTNLLELLDYPALRRGANLREDELAILRDWMRETNVYWGADGMQKTSFGLPHDDVHTWQSGIDRLMLGYAMGDVEALVLDRLPYGEANMERADLLGRFVDWTQMLFGYLDALQPSRTLADWAELLLHLLDDLFVPFEAEEQQAVLFLREVFEELVYLHHLVQAGAVGTTAMQADLNALRAHVEEKLSMYKGEERIVTGRITFVDFLTLRYTPYRVVAVVGLNDGVFPRHHQPIAFDIQVYERLPGDVDPRSSDKQLFLDALLATRDRLLLTYVGRSQKDNSDRAPSVVLDMLFDVCVRSFETPDNRSVMEWLVTRHRLQPFSTTYFNGQDNRFFSYASRHCVRTPEIVDRETVSTFFGQDTPDAEEERIETSLNELTEAWVNPSKYYCTRRLGLRLRLEDLTLSEEEPILLDSLQAYSLKTQLLDYALREMPEPLTMLRSAGSLPPGSLGDAWYTHLNHRVLPIAEYLIQQGDREQVVTTLEDDNWLVTGQLEHVSASRNLLFRCASVKGKDLIRAWISHLLLNAFAEKENADVPRITQLLGENTAYYFPPLDEAHHHVDRLIRGLRAIRREPPPLFELASHKYVENGEYKARQAFEGSYGNVSDLQDRYVSLCFRGKRPLDDSFDLFVKWAEALWRPIVKHRREGWA